MVSRSNGPLTGLRVLVTRPAHQASSMCEALAREGAEAIPAPAIAITPIPDSDGAIEAALRSLSTYQWVIFTSVNGVEVFFDRLHELQLNVEALEGVSTAAIGPATSNALRRHGVVPQYVPPAYLSTALVEGMASLGVGGARVLLARAEIGGAELKTGLEELGARVDQLSLYRTEVPGSSHVTAREAFLAGNLDVATFTSPSTVRYTAALLGEEVTKLDGVTVACIGPVTAEAARELDIRVDVVALQHTMEGLVDALKSYFSNGRRQP